MRNVRHTRLAVFEPRLTVPQQEKSLGTFRLSPEKALNVWDNSPMESFFSSLKTDCLARKTFRTWDQIRAEVLDYIERFYNPVRRHSTLGYLSPIEFEQHARCA